MAEFKNKITDVVVSTENEFVLEQFRKSDDYEEIVEEIVDKAAKSKEPKE